MKFRTLFVGIPVLLTATAINTQAQTCGSLSKDSPVKTALATASLWDNVRNKKGSLKFESAQLISAAEQAASSAPKTEMSCPDGCISKTGSIIVFKSSPRKFLKEYSDSKKCAEYFDKTKKNPIVYRNRSFNSLDTLNDWFNEFSQGKGKDGKDLYSRCDGSCSPQYTCLISKTENGSYSLTAKVICGPARDKDDNMYNLSSSLRGICEKRKE